MDPKSIELENLSKIFEYEKLSRELDSCDDLEYLRNVSKCYAKLYFKQQETLTLIDLDLFKENK
jgi:hypothetical protein